MITEKMNIRMDSVFSDDVKVNIKMLKNRNIKMYRAPIFIPPAVLPKRIVFL